MILKIKELYLCFNIKKLLIMSDFNFFMRQVGTDDETEYALGEKFPSLRMRSVTGLLVDGDPTNVYFEEFKDSPYVKVFVGSESAKVGTLAMNIAFVGEDCAEDFKAFKDFISHSVLRYRDTYRTIETEIVQSKKPNVTTDRRRGAESLIECTFTFSKFKTA